MTNTERAYVPAAGRHWRLPFYDLMAKLLGADRARALLVDEMKCEAGQRVLEIGCGTGSLLLLVKKAQRGTEVTGLDPDPGALAIARRKAERAGVHVGLDRGFADALPYDAGTFDRVVSSLMFHHLPRSRKEAALREAGRVLSPGGTFHMLDFGGPDSGGRGFLARRLHASQHLRDNDENRVLELFRAAGLREGTVTRRLPSHLGEMVYYRAGAPSPSLVPS
jgi:ubiquinone/menaquinone biosynthesis C-methylase UbiE